jgi:hypothetical protein
MDGKAHFCGDNQAVLPDGKQTDRDEGPEMGASVPRTPSVHLTWPARRILAWGLFCWMLLLLAGCTSIPPVVHHEGLPAYIADCWPPELSGGSSLLYWRHDSIEDGMMVFSGAVRTGQHLGPFSVEEGISTIPAGNILLGPFVGIGLRRPAITLRGSAYPVVVDGRGVTARFRNVWWQAHLLAGTPFRARGLGGSIGAEASPYGIGPIIMGELATPDVLWRAELAHTWKAPWTTLRVEGRVLSLGITAAARFASSRKGE